MQVNTPPQGATKMRATIETIDDKLCTVIFHCEKAFAEFDHSIAADFENMQKVKTTHGFEIHHEGNHVATALFALPTHPTKDDMKLLSRYASEGIQIISATSVALCDLDECGYDMDAAVVRCSYGEDELGNRLEVAFL